MAKSPDPEPVESTFTWLDLLDWPSLQPEHQPDATVMPRTPPPTQPNPLVNGNLQTIITQGSAPPARISSNLIGANTNPLVTKPPAAPSTSETLVVALDPGLPTVSRKVNAMVAVPLGGLAPTAILACPAAGTKITALSLSINPPLAQAGNPRIEVLIDVAGVPTNILFRGTVGCDNPINLAWDGPVFAGQNLQISSPARGGSEPTVSLYYNVYGRDVT